MLRRSAPNGESTAALLRRTEKKKSNQLDSTNSTLGLNTNSQQSANSAAAAAAAAHLSEVNATGTAGRVRPDDKRAQTSQQWGLTNGEQGVPDWPKRATRGEGRALKEKKKKKKRGKSWKVGGARRERVLDAERCTCNNTSKRGRSTAGNARLFIVEREMLRSDCRANSNI